MYHDIKRALAAGALLLGVAPLALAAPSVSGTSGTASSGQTLTISGNGFGSKSTAAPLLWDDFEAGTAGNVIAGSAARVGKWDGSNASVKYTTAKVHAGNKAAFHDFISNYNASLNKDGSFPRLYMDFWILTDYVDRQSRNWKPWRLYGDNDSLQLDYVWLCNGQLGNRVEEKAGWSMGDWGGNGYSKNTWMHIQLVYGASSPGGADGTIRHTIDGQTYGMNSGAVMTRKTSANFNQVRIGHYWAQDGIDGCSSNGGARVYVDNVYLDTSWARVELGNASSYAASTKREIQVPTAWSDSSVKINVNTGTFTAGSTAYLFVTDANNNTSPGIAIKVGATGTSVTPNPPTSVTVE